MEDTELLTRELSHGIKNILAVGSGLITLSARTLPDVKGCAHELQERVEALGRAHQFIRPQVEQMELANDAPTLHAVLRQMFAPDPDRDRRFRITGDDVPIDDKGVTPISLVFHELATNAAKYGALSVDDGGVEITVCQMGDRLKILWTEHGGPLVTMPKRFGFGSRLTTISAEKQLGGTIERRWRTAGLEVEMTGQPSRLIHLSAAMPF